MKKGLTFLLTLFLLLSLAACGGKKEAEETPVVRVGVIEPFSGEDSLQGWRAYLGVICAHEAAPQVKVNRTTYDVELRAVNSQAGEPDAEGVSEAARTLIEDGAAVVLGSVSAADSAAFERAGIPVLGLTEAGASVEGNDHYFRLCPTAALDGAVLARFARSRLGAGRVYCLYEQGDAVAETSLRAFRERAEELSLAVTEAPYLRGCGDFTAYFRQLLDVEAEAIVCLGSAETADTLLAQMDTFGLDFPVLAASSWDGQSVLDAAAGTELSVYAVSCYAEGADSAFDAAVGDFLAAEPDWLAANGGESVWAATALGYDAYNLALEAMGSLGSVDPADLLAGLPGVSAGGVTGSIRFDEDGGAIWESAYVKKADTENGVWVYVTRQST